MFIYWSMFLIFLSIMFMILFLEILFSNKMFIIEYFLMTILNVDFKFYFLLDWISLIFSSIVLLISGVVILYSFSYMSDDKNKNSFCLIVLLFVLSMLFLILMPNMFMLILGWDGLGLVSYCLVIHYQSVNSYNSGMMTVLSNRVGDVMIIMSLIFFFSFGSFDLMSLNKIELICGIMILVAGLTKSAQIPFSAWLPAAMAAPTPVSSLVHSSTLVTAGVYLLLRFNLLFKLSLYSEILMKISLLTMLMSGINAFFENDFKKIIAFSTLSQLSLMMISISLNMINLAFLHLIMHAIFKSMLFLCAGLIIHSFFGIQDIRMLGNFFNVSPLISSVMMISILSLMGFPFIGGFYSKDLIVEMFFFKMNNIILILVFMLGLMFTFLYCSRMIFLILLKGTMNSSMMKFDFNFYMNLPILILCFFMLVSGVMISWFVIPNFSTIFISSLSKNFIIPLMMISIMIFIIFKKVSIYSWKLDFFFKIWNLSFLTSYIVLFNSKNLLKVSMNDWTWMEHIGPSTLKKNLSHLYNFNSWIEIKNLNKILIMLLLCLLIFMV
uniref:NADH-ubiquinone oxidoreductase chain 5 n=1 Tax=Amblyomma javanense TaxID=1658007 RepID=A0A4Y5UCT7_9ACAR|nr:NADH dehydrogenase subunit 5 [Amblyomma javanense]QDC21273.1 NADH dehydrogenase subunit 5 [Amblyomma javanense]